MTAEEGIAIVLALLLLLLLLLLLVLRIGTGSILFPRGFSGQGSGTAVGSQQLAVSS